MFSGWLRGLRYVNDKSSRHFDVVAEGHISQSQLLGVLTFYSIPGKVYSLLFTVDLRCLRLYRILSDSSELV